MVWVWQTKRHKLEALSMASGPSQRILNLRQLHAVFSKACSNRDLGSMACQVIKSNATACLSQRGDVSYLILRELNKGSLTLSTEGLASCSAPWGWETRENGLHFGESPFTASWMGRKDTTLAPQSLPMAESLSGSRRDFIWESWFASASKLQN